MNKPVRVLFVCLGNICRSPAAHAVFEHMIEVVGAEGLIEVDSAGILDYHKGELPDPRMRKAANRRGYELTHRSRPVSVRDFQDFDLLIAMDRDVLRSLNSIRNANQLPGHATIELFMKYVDPSAPDQDVPDPYWSGADGFEHVMDLVECGCRNLLIDICKRNQLTCSPAP